MSDLDALIGPEDPGQDRLDRAHRLIAKAREVCRKVAGRHAVRVGVVIDPPPDLKHKRHVVMARSHAAWTLHETGLSYTQIASVLHCDHGAARRMALRWLDHKAGLLQTISEAQAEEVDRLIAERGLTQAEACAEVGVGVTRYNARKMMMLERVAR